MKRIDVVGQNGNDGLHYEYELDKSTGEVIKKYTNPDKLNQEYSDEFWNWYRFFLQSPSLCSLQYDDEKMWEAWKASKGKQK